MNKYTKPVFILTMILAVLWLPRMVRADTFQLYGRVTNQSGTPIAGAVVEVLDPNTTAVIASDTTDSGGDYSMQVEEGTYDVRITPPAGSGFSDSISPDQLIDNDTNLDVALVPAGLIAISGRLVNSIGNPITNGRVYMNGVQNTDASGQFSMQITPGQPVELSIEDNGYDPNLLIPSDYYLVAPDQTYMQDTNLGDIVIEAFQVDVHVQDPLGNPVAGAHVNTSGGSAYGDVSMGGRNWTQIGSSASGITNANGDTSFFLFPTFDPSYYPSYTFDVSPPNGTPFAPFSLLNVTVTSDKSLVFVVQFVHVPPVTTAVLTPTSVTAGTYPGPVTVSLSATATDDYVVDTTYYRIDGGAALVYTSTFVVSGDGVHTIQYWSVDDFGVYETPKNQTFEIATLQILTESPLPGGVTGELYTVMLEALGGRSPYTWSVSGSSLPSGLLLDSATGLISGTPTVGGSVNVTVAVTDDDGTMVEKALNLAIESPFTDLSLSSADITFAPVIPDPTETVNMSAVIRNPGWADLTDVVVSFYDFDALIGQATIGSLPAGTAVPVSLQTSFADAGFRLITVKVDPDDAITELNEANNEASQVLQVGSPDFSTATMVVQASAAATCQGSAVSVNGRADYDFSEIPGTQDYPVQGGNVTVTVLDATGSNILGVFTGAKTGVSGSYNQPILAPASDGTYPAIVTVTDGTITDEFETAITISGACATPPPPPPPAPGTNPPPPSGPPDSTPGASADVYVYSEHIQYSDENPDTGEMTTIFAYINYVGSDPALNIPVTLNDIYPVDGILRTFQINSTLVSFPNGQANSPVIISVPWTNTAPGAHIIQVVINDPLFSLPNGQGDNPVAIGIPKTKTSIGKYMMQIVTEAPFSQFIGNDKAKRLIMVGDAPLMYILKSVSLLVDADGDGAISPGDTLAYTITYENQGGSEVTGAVITDDYDETLLEVPTQISNAGTAVDGVITWNLGTLAAGAAGSVTYEIAVVPENEFPSGRSVIVNYALLSTDQTPAVAAAHEIEVIVTPAGQPPTVGAGGPYNVDEGGSVAVAATGIDPDGDLITYAWDLDNNGSFETAGQSVPFSAANLDGPGTMTIAVQATDPGGLTAVAQASVTVHNVAPVVGEITASTYLAVINTFVQVATTFADAGLMDTHTAVWAWGDGTTSTGTVAESNGTGTVTGGHTYFTQGIYTVRVTVTDDDGAAAESILEFIVVYNPNGGYLTGVGGIDSPAGAYAANPTLTGPGNFGMYARYVNGALTGKAQYSFPAANLLFRSTSFDWLVVTGDNAVFRGQGTINNRGHYGFIVTVFDGKNTGTADRFRIRIWDMDNGNVEIYDNGYIVDNEPTQAISSGKIDIYH